ncbi:MAG: hypothetical protein ABJ277_05280, partial [Flavobacteriaceae bacterium]
MARLRITSENQIQRLNQIVTQVKSFQVLNPLQLTKVPNAKSWNVVEVIAHLNISYGFYLPKFDDALQKLPTLTSHPKEFKARPWQKFVIEGQRPKNGVRKMKMKTLKRFTPLLIKAELTPEKIESIFDQFFELHEHLKQCIIASRTKDISKIKISSAIGSIVNFYLPESFEFLLCHLE